MKKRLLLIVIGFSILLSQMLIAESSSKLRDYFPFKLYVKYSYELKGQIIRTQKYLDVKTVGSLLKGMLQILSNVGNTLVVSHRGYLISDNQLFLEYSQSLLGTKIYDPPVLILKFPEGNKRIS